ncbi:esterase-like activity of phytase family protein [Marinivivus vitaminiproducens]|uniref:esterase-like activity of phytase family protein n=1 Tax=Marinivivus vitaminiproducens TaxID=3035935 RepID=UPI00279B64B2|nr:esterase-like activity of phytase family protein [Geminicoccaceae bacterium SCSIO 64248]
MRVLTRLRATALLVPLAACSASGAPAADAPITVDARPIVSEPMIAGRLELTGGFVLSSGDGEFGGLSGLLVEGERLTAETDRGHLWTARLSWDDEGRLREPDGWGVLPFVPDGLDGHRDPDTEDIARMPSGDLAVALEGNHRILRYAGGDPRSAPASVAVPDGLADAPGNGGVEALTVLPSGGLLMLVEELMRPDGRHAAWYQAGPDAPWQAFGYRAAEGFKPTSADVHDGFVYVLERRFALPFGFAARVTRFPVAALRADGDVEPEELALLRAPFPVDNMEGLAVAPAPGGGADLYLVSDDNFMPLFQRTLLLQFHLQEAVAPVGPSVAGR